MKRIDIMVDLETLGKHEMNPVIQLSAVAFDIHSGRLLSEFNVHIRLEDKLTVDASTLDWWIMTDLELFAELIKKGNATEFEAFEAFGMWVENLWECNQVPQSSVYLWGNGILFDNKIIQGKMQALGLTYPIYYANDRDVRTIVDLYCTRYSTDARTLKAKFHAKYKEHDALQDCYAQIEMVSACYRDLVTGGM